MKRIIRAASTDNEIVVYKIGAMDAFDVLGLDRKFPNHVRSIQTGNYETYRLIGTMSEIADVIDYCKDKLKHKNALRRAKPTSRDINWYRSVR